MILNKKNKIFKSPFSFGTGFLSDGKIIQTVSSTPPIDPDAQAFITAAVITDPTQQQAINTLVLDLKGYGIWSKMKAIYPFVGGTAAQHKWNLKDPRDLDAAFRLVFYGGVTHSSTGAEFNGTNAYADTYVNPSINLTNGNFHLSYYNRSIATTQANSNDLLLFRVYTISGNVALRTLNRTGNAYFSGGNDSTEVAGGSSTTAGFVIGTETSNSSRKLFKNNSLLGSNTTSSSTALGNAKINIAGNSYTNYAATSAAFISIGDGLTDTEAANFYTSVQAFQTTLGRSIGTQTVSDADAQAFVNAADIQDQVQATAINNLTIGLKADGLWTKMKAVYPFVGGTAASHKFNLKNPLDTDAAFRLVFSGGWTHSSTGALPNGTNGYADTFFIPNNHLTVNSTNISSYLGTNNTPIQSDPVDIGAYSTVATIAMTLVQSSLTLQSRNLGNLISVSQATRAGFATTTKTSSTLTTLYKNGVSVASGNSGGNLPTNKVFIGTLDLSGSPYAQGYVNNQFRFISIGDGLNATEAANLYSRVQTYQTALSRNV